MKSEQAWRGAFESFRPAALPLHSAERLSLSGASASYFEAAARESEA